MKRMCTLLLTILMVHAAYRVQAMDFSSYIISPGEMLLEYEVKSSYTASVEWDGEKQDLLVFDDKGKLIRRQSLGMKSRYDAAVVADHPQGGCMVVLVKWGNDDEMMTLWRLDAKGNILWDSAIPKDFSYNWDILCDDGQGGVYFVFSDPDNYKLAQVWHWDAQGNVLWNKVIEAENLIFSHFSGRMDGERDRLVIGGHAVSKSRGIYDVLILEIDREGHMEAVQRKDFSIRPDYGFDVLMDGSGAFYAHSRADYLDTAGTPRVMVPIDVLPDAPQREVFFRDEYAPETYYYNANGGKKYHVKARCGSIDEKYYGYIREFGASQLKQMPYSKLEACSYCGADRR